MMAAHVTMQPHRLGSLVLLAGGVVLVFAGLTASLGFSLAGTIASAAAIAALLYAGGVWFGGSGRDDASVVVFTPMLTVAVGPFAGRPLADLFPPAARDAIERECRAAFDGRPMRFAAGGQTYDAAPVRAADGAIVYGILIAGAPMPATAGAAG